MLILIIKQLSNTFHIIIISHVVLSILSKILDYQRFPLKNEYSLK